MSEALPVFEPGERFVTLVLGIPRVFTVSDDGTPVEDEPYNTGIVPPWLTDDQAPPPPRHHRYTRGID